VIRLLPEFILKSDYIRWNIPYEDSISDLETEIAHMVAINFFSEILTDDIIVHEIFSRLQCKELLNFGLVDKKIQRLANDPLVMKDKIYLEKVFSPLDWQLFFGFGIEDDTLARNQLPNNIVELFKDYPHQFNNITWIPEGISINSFGDLLKKYYQNNKKGYAHIDESIQREFGKICTTKGQWVLVNTLGIINKEIPKKFSGINFRKNPDAIEAIVSKFADRIHFKFDDYTVNYRNFLYLGAHRVLVDIHGLGIRVLINPNTLTFPPILVRGRGVGGIRPQNQPFLY